MRFCDVKCFAWRWNGCREWSTEKCFSCRNIFYYHTLAQGDAGNHNAEGKAPLIW